MKDESRKSRLVFLDSSFILLTSSFAWRDRPAGADGVKQLQLPVGPVDREGADRALLLLAHPVCLVGGVQARPGSVHGQAARARAHLVDARSRPRPRLPVYPESVDATAVAGREVYLGRKRVAQRRTEGPDVGEERLVVRRPEECRCGERGRGLKERAPGGHAEIAYLVGVRARAS